MRRTSAPRTPNATGNPRSDILRRTHYIPPRDVHACERIAPMKVRIEDVQSGDWSELVVNNLHYDVKVPEAVFDARKLAEVSANPLWSVK